jgi:hypothetical protein
MGASGWHYVVPYNDDLEDALQELRMRYLHRVIMASVGCSAESGHCFGSCEVRLSYGSAPSSLQSKCSLQSTQRFAGLPENVAARAQSQRLWTSPRRQALTPFSTSKAVRKRPTLILSVPLSTARLRRSSTPINRPPRICSGLCRPPVKMRLMMGKCKALDERQAVNQTTNQRFQFSVSVRESHRGKHGPFTL